MPRVGSDISENVAKRRKFTIEHSDPVMWQLPDIKVLYNIVRLNDWCVALRVPEEEVGRRLNLNACHA